MKKLIIACILLTTFTGCNTLNSVQRQELIEMKSEGVAVQEKSKGTAAALGILPGGGSFYTRQYGLGVVDLLLWPFSILWDPVVGAKGAEYLNYEASKMNVARKNKK